MDARDDDDRHGHTNRPRPGADREQNVKDGGRDENGEGQTVMRPVLSPQVQLGQLLTFGGTILTVGVPALYLAATMQANINRAFQDFADLKSQQTESFAELRRYVDQRFSGVDSRFDAVQKQIADLPDTTARLTSVEHALISEGQSDAARDARIAAIDERSLETAAKVDQIVPPTVQLGAHRR